VTVGEGEACTTGVVSVVGVWVSKAVAELLTVGETVVEACGVGVVDEVAVLQAANSTRNSR
jgi:hypothetical protein